MKYEIGSRIRITAEEATYEGTVYTYDEHIHRVILEKVIGFPGAKVFYHLMIFFENQILKAEVIEKNTSKKGKLAKRNKGAKSESETRNNETIRPEAVSPSIEKNKGGDPKNTEESIVHVIKDVDQKFYEAIEYLKKQSCLSLSVDGINVGRFGEICLLQIGTKNKEIYQFNMIAMGRVGYELGLLELLACPNIQKIIHDGRWISDALHYQLNVNLVSVYDTQVADRTIYKMQHNGRFPDQVRTLEECLDDYLNVKIEKFSLAKKDHRYWKSCMEDEDVLKKFVQKVIFLHDLQSVTTEKMLTEFRRDVEIYLNSVKSLPDFDAQKVICVEHPPDLTEREQSRQKENKYRYAEDLQRNMRRCYINGTNDAKQQTDKIQETQSLGVNISSDFESAESDSCIINWDIIRDSGDSSNSSSGIRTQKSKVQYWPAGCSMK